VYAKSIGNLLHEVDTGLKGPGHGLTPIGVAAREVRLRAQCGRDSPSATDFSTTPALNIKAVLMGWG